MTGRTKLLTAAGLAGLAACAVAVASARTTAPAELPADEIRRQLDAAPTEGRVLMYGERDDLGPLTPGG